MLRIGVLNNLRAGQGRRRAARLRELLRGHPHVLHVETDSVEAVPEALAALSGDGVELLVLNGGDGTLQHALTRILSWGDLGRLRFVAPLRGGRTNMTALDLGARRDPVAALAALLRAAEERRLDALRVDRPVLRVASSRGGAAHCGMFFGAGTIRRAIELTHRVFPDGRSQGVFGASLVTAALLARILVRPTSGILTPDKIEIRIDGRSLQDAEFYLVIASSLRRLFLRMNPFWGEGPGDVRVTALSSGVRRLARATPRILRGRPVCGGGAEDGYTSENAERVELRLGCGYTVDGEIFEPHADEHLIITADRRLRFLRA